MSLAESQIILLRGAPGAGKSQTAKCLAELFPKGVRLEVDTLRSMVNSPDWTNQEEHINILNISTKLVVEFLSLGFNPIIVVDTFSGNKLIKYIDSLKEQSADLTIEIFGLYVSTEELRRRLELRREEEFRDLEVCLKLNKHVTNVKLSDEVQIDTTGRQPEQTARIIYKCITSNK